VRRVFISGCWDLLHTGHVEALELARAQGEHLTVSVAADETVRALKREPVIGEHARWRMVAALRCVDAAFVCRGEHSARDCFAYVRNLRPDVWVIDAADPFLAEKEELAAEVGAVVVLNHRPEHGEQTTRIIRRVRECAS
jgi:cytidyltransferase-like protein